jgi:hypothetical protein
MVLFKTCHKATHRSGYMSPITSRPFSSKPKIWELRLKVLIQKNIRGFKISINNLYNCGRKRLKFYNWKEAAFKCTKTFNVKPRKLRSFINKIRYTMPACTIHSFSKSQKKKDTLRKRSYNKLDAENEFCQGFIPWQFFTIISCGVKSGNGATCHLCNERSEQ